MQLSTRLCHVVEELKQLCDTCGMWLQGAWVWPVVKKFREPPKSAGQWLDGHELGDDLRKKVVEIVVEIKIGTAALDRQHWTAGGRFQRTASAKN
jgi:hypothetical protein